MLRCAIVRVNTTVSVSADSRTTPRNAASRRPPVPASAVGAGPAAAPGGGAAAAPGRGAVPARAQKARLASAKGSSSSHATWTAGPEVSRPQLIPSSSPPPGSPRCARLRGRTKQTRSSPATSSTSAAPTRARGGVPETPCTRSSTNRGLVPTGRLPSLAGPRSVATGWPPGGDGTRRSPPRAGGARGQGPRARRRRCADRFAGRTARTARTAQVGGGALPRPPTGTARSLSGPAHPARTAGQGRSVPGSSRPAAGPQGRRRRPRTPDGWSAA